jgi:hypothetical protein
MFICIVATQVFGKRFPLHQVGLDWGGQQYDYIGIMTYTIGGMS